VQCGDGMRLLIVTDYIPYPPVSGNLVRVYNLARRIALHHEVSMVGFLQPDDKEGAGIVAMRQFCKEVEAIHLPTRSRPRRLVGKLRHLVSGQPFDFEFLHSAELLARVNRLADANDYAIVQIEPSRMAQYAEAFPPRTRARRLIVFHNVGAQQYSRIARIEPTRLGRWRAWLLGKMLSGWEPRCGRRFERCITVSELDRQYLMATNGHLKVDVVPNGVDTQSYQCLGQDGVRPGVLFVGNMGYAPCADGALWFFREVYPQVQRAGTGLEMWIVGSSPPPAVAALDGNGVHVTGRVGDVVPYYRRCAVTIVPLRAGGGTRLKILEAMALGRPVVSTTIGCEGLDVVSGEHLLIADDPAEFAQCTLRLMHDQRLWQRVVNNARRLVVERYDWDVIARQLLRVYSEVTGN